jgi:hypothetical protein
VSSFGAEKKVMRKQSAVKYPADHKLGMRVPLGGSDCAKCEYVDVQDCTNDIFIKWNGSSVIPEATNSYCCDMFEAKEKSK